MGGFKVFPILVICSCGLVESMLFPKKILDYYDKSEMVTVPVVTSSSPLSSRYLTLVDIPKECEKIGFCEYSGTYPTELAEQLISKMKATGLFTNREANPMSTFSIESRLITNRGENPCSTKKERLKPMIGLAADGNWYFILNSDEESIYVAYVEICAEGENPPWGTIILKTPYEAKCIQKYINGTMSVILDKDREEKTFEIPVACSCVAVY
ncbi:uncharacterized protein [Epargyreus clarus]|uniref:uncharacterized protein n=1 Tax=Epargyreus clarus TaxID=520877 RepID=UPI003C2FA5DB